MIKKQIFHLWRIDDSESYDLKVIAGGSAAELIQIKEQLAGRLFRIHEYSDHITAVFTGEWLDCTNKIWQLKAEGWKWK